MKLLKVSLKSHKFPFLPSFFWTITGNCTPTNNDILRGEPYPRNPGKVRGFTRRLHNQSWEEGEK
jgi:hypothetical protein